VKEPLKLYVKSGFLSLITKLTGEEAALLDVLMPVIINVTGVGTSVVEVSLFGVPLICPVDGLIFRPVFKIRLSGDGETKNWLKVPARITEIKVWC
jgi:hypothetical protein